MVTLQSGDIYTLEEKIDILFKKDYGLSSTGIDKEYYQEDFTNGQRQYITPDQIMSDGIPETAPNFQYTDTQAELGGTNPIPGVTTPVDYSFIKKYLKKTMEPVGYSENSFILSELKNSVPFTFDSGGTYQGILYRNDGSTIIPFGYSGGSWFIDHNTGILTFHDYDQVSSFVNPDNPPVITFFRYEGTFGLTQGITNAPSVISEIFNGGDSSGTADTLSSIIVDDRDLGTFSTSQYSRSFNIGGYFDGSWRILVRGGGNGVPENTALTFQKRIGGSWITKNEII